MGDCGVKDSLGARDHDEVEVDGLELAILETEEISDMLGDAAPRRRVGVCMRGSKDAPDVRRDGVPGVKLLVRCREANVEP